ncbi:MULTISPECIES: RidA family protein [unclassified Paracoccus (in: a-proteobacteria)]|uniref:RidA family protein n=1 Tax=unclassified Paracoccus (in: a-proteobacteria) TaxID=2688777 RepID=UPI0012B3898F|nr:MULTISPECIES: RidA family protein [unclassified Paracoccus (in: a-proteobacteria)]UXU75726.1 RidA family protein [Paracoccus sp. SMMA_5]UXU81632.1 RidA family protein [Paracoccus sp. SMMA_5_TC]
MRRISTGSPLETSFGYSRAVVKGPWCFVSGTTGYDYAAMAMPESAADQTRNALATIFATLAEAGFQPADIVRVQYTITDTAWLDEVVPVLGAAMKDVLPAATMVVAGLVRPEMKIEIEVTAFRE